MGTLILVRHATTAASETGRNLGQRGDPPLAAAGHALATRLGTTLAAELAEIAHDELRVMSSPALRCRQTATAVADAVGADAGAIEIAGHLIEIAYGEWDGLTADECRRRDPVRRAAWEADPYRTRCPGGESGADVAARAFAVLDPLREWLAAGRSRSAIVVAHNHVNRVWLCALMGWPMRDYRDRLAQDPAGYSMVTFGPGEPVVRRLNAAPA